MNRIVIEYFDDNNDRQVLGGHLSRPQLDELLFELDENRKAYND